MPSVLELPFIPISGRVKGPCLVCAQNRSLRVYRIGNATTNVPAAMCDPCELAYRAGELPFHPYWCRTPADPPMLPRKVV